MLKETDFKSYSFVQKEKIDELNGYGYVLEHKKTGARVLLRMMIRTRYLVSHFVPLRQMILVLLIFWNILYYVVRISFHQKIHLLSLQKVL